MYEAANLLKPPKAAADGGSGSLGRTKCTDLGGARTSLRISPFLIFCLFFLYFQRKNKLPHSAQRLIIDFGHHHGISGKSDLDDTF